MKRDTLGTLRARIAEQAEDITALRQRAEAAEAALKALEDEDSAAFDEYRSEMAARFAPVCWGDGCKNRLLEEFQRRAEVAEAALTEIAEMERRLPNCITTEAKLLRRAIAAARVVVEGKANAK